MADNDQDTSLAPVSSMTDKIEAATALAKILPGIVPGSLKTIDKGLSTGVEGVLNVLNFHGLQLWNERRKLVAERNMRKLIKEFERVDQDDLVPAAMEIETPILEKLSTTSDERLSEILIKLLVAAASKSNCHLVHPSMITVAENLSPDEALLMDYWSPRTDLLPMIEVKFIDRRPEMKQAYATYAKYFSVLNDWEGLANSANIDFYIGNLISLGLFEYESGFIPIKNETGGNEIHPQYAELKKAAWAKYSPLVLDKKNLKFESSQKILSPTEKGKLFISILNTINIDEGE